MSFDISRFKKAARRVSRFLAKNSRRPKADTVHNLRTSLRSLEVTFATLELTSKGRMKGLQRYLKKIRKRAGKVREMDVLTANALTLKSDGQQDCQVVFLEHLGAERDKHAKKLNRDIDKAGSSFRQKLKRTSKRAEDVLRQATTNPGESETASATIAKAIQLSADLHRPIRLSKQNLHGYRLKVKELRNVLQLSDRTANAEFFRSLGAVKDAIGDWHDWEELAGIATTVLDHRGCKLIGRVKATAESKYKHALSLTNELRKTHLKSQAKGRASRGAGAVLSNSALSATSALAQP